MGSLSLSAIASLDHSLALLSESLENLKAARSVEMAEVVDQLKVAAESAHTVCELVWSELPEASWQTRQELDALIDQIQKISKTRTVEQQRSRLLALAAELERGSIVHRRAQAVSDTPPTLPGPAAERWVNWACSLQEPQDAECLRILQSGFARLDDFVANLEPDMWRGGGSPPVEIVAGAERTVDTKQSEASRWETSEFEEPLASSTLPEIETTASQSPSRNDKSPFPDVLHEHDPRAFESNTLTPHDATPRRSEEASQQVTAQERALLAGMMGLINEPVGHFSPQVGGPLTAALFRATSAVEPVVASDAVAHFSLPVEGPHTAEAPRGTGATPAAVASEPVGRFDPSIEPIIEFPVKEKAAGVAADGDPVGDFGHPVEHGFAPVFPETSTAPAVPSETDAGGRGGRAGVGRTGNHTVEVVGCGAQVGH